MILRYLSLKMSPDSSVPLSPRPCPWELLSIEIPLELRNCSSRGSVFHFIIVFVDCLGPGQFIEWQCKRLASTVKWDVPFYLKSYEFDLSDLTVLVGSHE